MAQIGRSGATSCSTRTSQTASQQYVHCNGLKLKSVAGVTLKAPVTYDAAQKQHTFQKVQVMP